MARRQEEEIDGRGLRKGEYKKRIMENKRIRKERKEVRAKQEEYCRGENGKGIEKGGEDRGK